jgi:hypothetical protein
MQLLNIFEGIVVQSLVAAGLEFLFCSLKFLFKKLDEFFPVRPHGDDQPPEQTCRGESEPKREPVYAYCA